MKDNEALKYLKEANRKNDMLCVLPNSNIGKCFINALEEIQKYREIGTVEECRAAMEKQKEMITYCDENDCSDCPFHNTSKKYNKCMNDFIAEEIVKGGGVNEQSITNII